MAIFCTSVPTVAAESESDGWKFEVAPYVWLPGIEGRLKYDLPPGGGDPEIGISGPDVLDMLNFALLLNGTARKGRFSINSDFVYLSLGKDTEGTLVSLNPDGLLPLPIEGDIVLATTTELDGVQWSLAFGYALRQTETSLTEVFVGTRYFNVESVSTWELTTTIDLPGQIEPFPRSGSIRAKAELWDGIVGIRGRHMLGGSRWAVPYAADIGAGSSDLTWNAMLGLVREFDWGGLGVAYRHLEYDQDDDALLQSFSFSGPAIFARFSF